MQLFRESTPRGKKSYICPYYCHALIRIDSFVLNTQRFRYGTKITLSKAATAHNLRSSEPISKTHGWSGPKRPTAEPPSTPHSIPTN